MDTRQCPWAGLEPELLNPEVSKVTLRPTHCTSIREDKSYFESGAHELMSHLRVKHYILTEIKLIFRFLSMADDTLRQNFSQFGQIYDIRIFPEKFYGFIK